MTPSSRPGRAAAVDHGEVVSPYGAVAHRTAARDLAQLDIVARIGAMGIIGVIAFADRPATGCARPTAPAIPRAPRRRRPRGILVPHRLDHLGQPRTTHLTADVAGPEPAHPLGPGRGDELVGGAGGVDAQRAAVGVVLVDPHVWPAAADHAPGQAELVEVDGPRHPSSARPLAGEQ